MNYAAIAAAMRAEIDDSKKLYMPNSPGAFVRDRLFKECHWEEAAYFWGCYCSRMFNSHELNNLFLKLEALAANEKMPDWGTKGT
jgi:hypothetical protein